MKKLNIPKSIIIFLNKKYNSGDLDAIINNYSIFDCLKYWYEHKYNLNVLNIEIDNKKPVSELRKEIEKDYEDYEELNNYNLKTYNNIKKFLLEIGYIDMRVWGEFIYYFYTS